MTKQTKQESYEPYLCDVLSISELQSLGIGKLIKTQSQPLIMTHPSIQNLPNLTAGLQPCLSQWWPLCPLCKHRWGLYSSDMPICCMGH